MKERLEDWMLVIAMIVFLLSLHNLLFLFISINTTSKNNSSFKLNSIPKFGLFWIFSKLLIGKAYFVLFSFINFWTNPIYCISISVLINWHDLKSATKYYFTQLISGDFKLFILLSHCSKALQLCVQMDCEKVSVFTGVLDRPHIGRNSTLIHAAMTQCWTPGCLPVALHANPLSNITLIRHRNAPGVLPWQ